MTETDSLEVREMVRARCGWSGAKKRAKKDDGRARVSRAAFTDELPGLRETSLRWLERAMSPRKPLSVATSNELALRCMLVTNTNLNARRLHALFWRAPRIIVLPDQARLVAEALANASGVGPAKRRALQKRFENYLLPFETVFHSRVGEAVVPHLRAAFGVTWDEFMDGKTRVSLGGEVTTHENWLKRLRDAVPEYRKTLKPKTKRKSP